MKMIYKIGILLFLSFFPNEVIQAQIHTTIGNDSVSYEIVKESISCKVRLNKKYEFEVLKVSHPNKAVQDSINHFFFRLQYESIAGISDSQVDYEMFEKALWQLCNDVEDENENYWVYIDTGEFDVVLNSRNIFTVGFRNYDVNGRGTMMLYSFNLNTGAILESSYIFNDKLNSLLNDLKQRTYEILKIEYKDLVTESDGNDYDAIEVKEIIEAIEHGKSFNNLMGYQLIIGEKGIEFEIHVGEYATNSYFHRNNPYSYYFSFMELKPYLTEEFKKLITQ